MPNPNDIWPNKKFYPKWLPTNISDRLAKNLISFVPTRDGWSRWYKGDNRFVCGKTTPLGQVDGCWRVKREQIDAASRDATNDIKISHSPTVEQLASMLYEYHDARVKTGKPKRMSVVTAWDYQRVINAFGRCADPDLSIDLLCPKVFSRYAKQIAGEKPSTWNRHVAYIERLIRWGLERGHLGNNETVKTVVIGQDPMRQIIGYDLVKVAQEDLRDHRIVQERSYEPSEIRLLWKAANDEERRWIALGLNGAFDNSDIANLPKEVMDSTKKVIDFRRRKRGKVRRIIPIAPLFIPLFENYKTPETDEKSAADYYFLTPTGMKLGRIGPGGPIDYVATRWTRLMRVAGLRAPVTVTRDSVTGKRKMKTQEGLVSDGRGFRSLRTTFTNLAPPGYRDEVEIITGHSAGGVLIDNYLEKFGFGRLEYLTQHVLHRAFSCPKRLDEECKCENKTLSVLPV